MHRWADANNNAFQPLHSPSIFRRESPVVAQVSAITVQPTAPTSCHYKEILENSILEAQSKDSSQDTGWKEYGVLHLIYSFLRWASAVFLGVKDSRSPKSFWTSGTSNPDKWSESERSMREIPQYVIDYAPVVHLHSEEEFWPCDIAEHLQHVLPYVRRFKLLTELRHRTVANLDGLNIYGLPIHLTSDDDVEEDPDWLRGNVNIPRESDVRSGCGGRSQAPVPLIVVNKGEGILDAFWFFFYGYNRGNKVMTWRFGNHVGDWEYAVVRFQNKRPTQMFFSQHTHGESYTYEALEKFGKRPVVYSAIGTHANYATRGTHHYTLPFGLLQDSTDNLGPLWDPVLNMRSYTYNLSDETLRSSNLSPRAPTAWFYFDGRWGDMSYSAKDERQFSHFGQKHYADGPEGPIWKNLNRTQICPWEETDCEVKNSLKIRSNDGTQLVE